MRPSRVLILGGTRDGRALAALLLEQGFDVVTSLAGITETPELPPGPVRRGGFGGIEGLAGYLASERIAAIADATHPFAAQMQAHAVAAAAQVGAAYLRLERAAWRPQAGDRWIAVASPREAASVLPGGARPLVTAGRKDIGLFFARGDVVGVARMIEPPATSIPANWTLLLARPPFTVEAEAALLARHAISHVVAKNSGGVDTPAKILAARQASLPVVMIGRPRPALAQAHGSAAELAAALRELLSP